MAHKIARRVVLSAVVVLIYFLGELNDWLVRGDSIKFAFCQSAKIFAGPLYALPVCIHEKDYYGVIFHTVILALFCVIQSSFVLKGGWLRACLAFVFWGLWLTSGFLTVVGVVV
jgi:hypothetical protein